MYFPSRCTTSCAMRAAWASCARARLGGQFGGVLCLGITEVDPTRRTCCSSASSAKSARSRPTLMWTLSTTGAKRSSSTSTANTARPRRHCRRGHHLPPRSVLRDVGKALGVSHPAVVDAFAKEHHWFDEDRPATSCRPWPNHWASPWRRPPACGWNWRASCTVFRAT